ncbi:hypothetical protein LguiB_032580 [Lonicera macranthoides]
MNHIYGVRSCLGIDVYSTGLWLCGVHEENLVASFVLEFCERGSPTCDRVLYLSSNKGSLLINGEEAWTS